MLYYCISKAKIVCSEHQGQRQSHRYTPSPNGKYVCIHRISKYIYSITSLWNSPVGIGDPGRLKASAGFLFFCFLRFFLPFCAFHLSQSPCYTGHQQIYRERHSMCEGNAPWLLTPPVPNEDAGNSISWTRQMPRPNSALVVLWARGAPENAGRSANGRHKQDNFSGFWEWTT